MTSELDILFSVLLNLKPRIYILHVVVLWEQHLLSLRLKVNAFFHHSGAGSWQINYITSSEKNLIHSYRIGSKEPEYTSSHVIVHCYLSTHQPEGGPVKIKMSSKSVRKLQWARADVKLYWKILEEECEKIGDLKERNVVQRLDELTKILHKTTENAVPYKLIKLKGLTSTTVKKLLIVCKQNTNYRSIEENQTTYKEMCYSRTCPWKTTEARKKNDWKRFFS